MAFYSVLLAIISVIIYSTNATTFDPIWGSPGVFISNRWFCAFPRCECLEMERSCCTPFGPSYGPTWTNGTVPYNACTNQFLHFEISTDPQDTTEYIYLQLYPPGYSEQTTVFYTIKSYGIISKSDFENVGNWTNYLDPLNNHSAISDTMLYPNKLNIKVETLYNGTLTISSGFTEGNISLNIASNRTCQIGENGSNCITYDECVSNALGFGLFITSCNTVNPYSCTPIYPYVLWIQISKSIQLCTILYPPIPTRNPSKNPTMPTMPTMPTTGDDTTNGGVFVQLYSQNHLFVMACCFLMVQIGY